MEVIKKDNYTIEVTKTENKETVQVYDYGFLKKQIQSILSQKQKYDDDRAREIAEINLLMKEAEKLGVAEKPEDTVLETTPAIIQ